MTGLGLGRVDGVCLTLSDASLVLPDSKLHAEPRRCGRFEPHRTAYSACFLEEGARVQNNTEYPVIRSHRSTSIALPGVCLRHKALVRDDSRVADKARHRVKSMMNGFSEFGSVKGFPSHCLESLVFQERGRCPERRADL